MGNNHRNNQKHKRERGRRGIEPAPLAFRTEVLLQHTAGFDDHSDLFWGRGLIVPYKFTFNYSGFSLRQWAQSPICILSVTSSNPPQFGRCSSVASAISPPSICSTNLHPPICTKSAFLGFWPLTLFFCLHFLHNKYFKNHLILNPNLIATVIL